MSLSKPVRDELPPRALSAEAGRVDMRSAALFELQKSLREEEELEAALEEREQRLESLHQRLAELQKEHLKVQESYLSFDMFLKDEAATQAVEKAERARTEVLQMDEKTQRLEEEKVKLMERNKEMEREVQRHSVYRDLMEQLLKMTMFKDMESLMDHLESLLSLRDHLCQKESEAQEQVDQLKKELVALDDQFSLLKLQKNNELSQLQTKLEDTCSEALDWERKWNHIQETAAKKTLQLGQIKMATLNLYEMTCGKLEEEEDVGMNDTVKQLDKIKMFIQDHEDMLKQLRAQSQIHNDGEKGHKGKKHILKHSKKH